MNDGYSEFPGSNTDARLLTVRFMEFSESRGPMRTLARALEIAQLTSGSVRFVCPQSRAEYRLNGSFLELIGWIAETGATSAEIHIDAPLEEAAHIRGKFQELFGA